MKSVMLIVLCVVLSATTVSAWDIVTTAKDYVSDQTMESLLVDKALSRKGMAEYCDTSGDVLMAKYGADHLLMRELGIRNAKVADAHRTACYTLVRLSQDMTADDSRALVNVLGSLFVADVKNHLDRVKVMDILHALDFFKNAHGFGSVTVLSALSSLGENQPNGYPKAVLDILGPIYEGKQSAALKALRTLRPDDEMKRVVANIAAAKAQNSKIAASKKR